VQQRKVALLGYGAIGQEIIKSCRLLPLGPQISTVVVRASACRETARNLGSDIQVFSELPSDVNLLIECAGHGGIDALSAAQRVGLESVVYVGRKPPHAWKGTDAERLLNLTALNEPATFFSGSARLAAATFPKNANVAATVSLAGIGFDRTQVRLIADPNITENTHEFHAKGVFGEIQIRMSIKPLALNPKTSALTVWSAVRFLQSTGLGFIT